MVRSILLLAYHFLIRYEANLICEDLGGFLMEPKTEEIQVTGTLGNCTTRYFQDLLSSLLLMLPGLSGELDWWIGLTDTGHEGSWLWVGKYIFTLRLGGWEKT